MVKRRLPLGPCFWCGCSGEMTRDHLVPAAAGGSHALHNIVPACSPCNGNRGRTNAFLFALIRGNVTRKREILTRNLSWFAYWVKMEKDRLGWSPTENLAAGRFCMTKIKRLGKYWNDEGLNRAARKRAKRAFDAQAFARWEDDGGPTSREEQ